MFKLMRPCATCPFRRDTHFALGEERLREIVEAVAFQCHKTVDYDAFDDDIGRQGDHPQQCAGWMAMLYRDPDAFTSTIMQVGERYGHLDPERLDPDHEAFPTVAAALARHRANDCPPVRTYRKR